VSDDKRFGIAVPPIANEWKEWHDRILAVGRELAEAKRLRARVAELEAEIAYAGSVYGEMEMAQCQRIADLESQLADAKEDLTDTADACQRAEETAIELEDKLHLDALSAEGQLQEQIADLTRVAQDYKDACSRYTEWEAALESADEAGEQYVSLLEARVADQRTKIAQLEARERRLRDYAQFMLEDCGFDTGHDQYCQAADILAILDEGKLPGDDK